MLNVQQYDIILIIWNIHVIVQPSKERIYIGIVPTSNPLTRVYPIIML